MKNLIKNNIVLAKKFNNTMRYMYMYIDDLLTLNNTQFDAAIQDMYMCILKFHIQHRELPTFKFKHPVKTSLWSVYFSASTYW